MSLRSEGRCQKICKHCRSAQRRLAQGVKCVRRPGSLAGQQACQVATIAVCKHVLRVLLELLPVARAGGAAAGHLQLHDDREQLPHGMPSVKLVLLRESVSRGSQALLHAPTTARRGQAGGASTSQGLHRVGCIAVPCCWSPQCPAPRLQLRPSQRAGWGNLLLRLPVLLRLEHHPCHRCRVQMSSGFVIKMAKDRALSSPADSI